MGKNNNRPGHPPNNVPILGKKQEALSSPFVVEPLNSAEKAKIEEARALPPEQRNNWDYPEEDYAALVIQPLQMDFQPDNQGGLVMVIVARLPEGHGVSVPKPTPVAINLPPHVMKRMLQERAQEMAQKLMSALKPLGVWVRLVVQRSALPEPPGGWETLDGKGDDTPPA